MNGKTARRLRRLAGQLGLPEETAYVPGGKLRRQLSFRHPVTKELLGGAPIPRPGVMALCFRRAYTEAKKIYTGKPLSTLAPDTEASPEAKTAAAVEPAPFRARLAESMKIYHDHDTKDYIKD